ncbi:MAG: metallophosphoesterase [Bacteroidales bacterium]|nr:metallophosphoesterase [Bacteroidales bacterium]
MAIIFFVVVAIYSILAFFTAIHIGKTIAKTRNKVVFYVAWGLLSYLFFIGRAVSSFLPDIVNRVIYVVGCTWLVIILYADILMALLLLARYIAKKCDRNLVPLNRATFVGLGAALVLIMCVGTYNAFTTHVTRYTVQNSQMQRGDTIRVAFISDLHLGFAIRRDDMTRLVDMINAENADICLIGGDFFDGDTRTVVDNDLAEPMCHINCKYGTYGVVGNHDYMAENEEVVAYLQRKGIVVLKDSAADVAGFRVIGRDDLSVNRRGLQRAQLAALTDSLPTIVIDHQPGAIDESTNVGALLHLSGHTHAGQVFPFNFATSAIYDIDYGKKVYQAPNGNQTTAIVTSGFGTWGPRVRIGTISEIVIIDVVGSKF